MSWDAAMSALKANPASGGHLGEGTGLEFGDVAAVGVFLAGFPVFHVHVGDELAV